jgi:hypothetical protein
MKIQESRKKNSFDPQTVLDTAGVARKVAEFRRSESIFSQIEYSGRIEINKSLLAVVLHD